MRPLKFIGVVGVVVFCSLVAFQASFETTSAADNDAPKKGDQVLVVCYKTTGLPVYREDGTHDLDMLMTLIQTNVSPKTWEARGGDSTMAPYAQNLSIVVSTTRKNHDKIASLLKRFRK